MDVHDILNPTGDLKQVSMWSKIWRMILSVLAVVDMSAESNTAALLKKVKCLDKVNNLKILGKHISIQAFKAQVDQKMVAPQNHP